MTKEGDIYSIGIVMKEIVTREGPYDAESKYMDMAGNCFISISDKRLCLSCSYGINYTWGKNNWLVAGVL